MEIRSYASTDAQATLDVFLSAVTGTASVHYSTTQIAAWSRPDDRDLVEWNSARQALNTFVAMVDGHIAGFADVSTSGYIDMMFVAPRFGRRGIATALLSTVRRRAAEAGAQELSTHASITARAFFERHGFTVVAEQHPITQGVTMTNFNMVRKFQGPGDLQRPADG